MNESATRPNAIAVAVDAFRRECGRAVDLAHRGPVPLNEFFQEINASHVALPELSRGSVRDYLRGESISVDDLGDPVEKLAGFIFVAGRVGWAFVSAADPLPRRRFTAAHELGHWVLHRGRMDRFRADTPESVLEDADADTTAILEREANRFAAELLMPAEVCQKRADEMRQAHRCCPRAVLAYRLAAELLVSREAMRYRLAGLGVGDE